MDVLPINVVECLSRVADIFVDYFGELNEHAIKDHFITVYELLDEMLDNGLPTNMEPNVLKEMITPPSMLNKVSPLLRKKKAQTLPTKKRKKCTGRGGNEAGVTSTHDRKEMESLGFFCGRKGGKSFVISSEQTLSRCVFLYHVDDRDCHRRDIEEYATSEWIVVDGSMAEKWYVRLFHFLLFSSGFVSWVFAGGKRKWLSMWWQWSALVCYLDDFEEVGRRGKDRSFVGRCEH